MDESQNSQPVDPTKLNDQFTVLVNEMAAHYKDQFVQALGNLAATEPMELVEPERLAPIMDDLARLARDVQFLFIRIGIQRSLEAFFDKKEELANSPTPPTPIQPEGKFIPNGEALKPTPPEEFKKAQD